MGNKNVRFNQCGEEEKTVIQENKVKIEVEVKEERRTSVEEGKEEGKRDSRIVTKFREFKEKTVLEVNKVSFSSRFNNIIIIVTNSNGLILISLEPDGVNL